LFSEKGALTLKNLLLVATPITLILSGAAYLLGRDKVGLTLAYRAYSMPL